ncbi:unnamed protein product [Pleuronectes platessa]|uniref:Uncharacterized protein n=1 Tax=Pleuronectes platessa TaxID=8262 RepID=A0A9N7TM19_PLEPL|nr:unnamed protein product [Pleuronectes platessa]
MNMYEAPTQHVFTSQCRRSAIIVNRLDPADWERRRDSHTNPPQVRLGSLGTEGANRGHSIDSNNSPASGEILREGGQSMQAAVVPVKMSSLNLPCLSPR